MIKFFNPSNVLFCLIAAGTLFQMSINFEQILENENLKKENFVLKIETDDLKKRLGEANIALNFEKTERELKATVIDSCFIQKIESCLKCAQETKK